nr:hypothetical protein CFP56_52631 [Quercus suber]
MVDEKGSDGGTGRSLISPEGNSDETVPNKVGMEFAVHDIHNHLQADSSRAIKGIEAVDQVSLISNSKGTTSNFEVRNKEVFSTENMGQLIFDMKKSCEVNMEPKDAKLMSTDKQELSFDMGWVEKSPLRKGGLTKTRSKDKGKLIGPSIISAQTMMDRDQLLKNGPKRKGDALSEDSTEVWEKEKRLRRTEDVDTMDGVQIRERLDRAVASLAWGERFKEARVYHLSNSASNHSPLSLHFFVKKKKRFKRKIFRFESMWLKDRKCENIVKNAWEEGSMSVGSFPISRCMELCRNRLEVWNKREFGHIGMKIDELQKKLEWLEIQATSPANISLVWSCSKLPSSLRLGQFHSFFDLLWFLLMIESFDEVKVALVVTVAWSLWSNWNSVRHGVIRKTPEALVQWASHYLSDYSAATDSCAVRPEIDTATWIPPPPSVLKINVDGALSKHGRTAGIGVLIRDDTGHHTQRTMFLSLTLQLHKACTVEGLKDPLDRAIEEDLKRSDKVENKKREDDNRQKGVRRGVCSG